MPREALRPAFAADVEQPERVERPESFAYKDLTGEDRWETNWTPVLVGWTNVGTPTVTGRFRIVGRQCFIQVEVIPATSTSTTAGTSYVELPITAQGFGGVGTFVTPESLVPHGTGVCVIDVANSRIYVSTKGVNSLTSVISGWYEI